jgi:DNA polymerase-3 subunit epsilon
MIITRPIVFLDFETTGIEITTARIVQIACVKINTDGTTEEKDILINPQIPIPKESTDVHGITDEMVKDAPTFKQMSKSFYKFLSGSDIGGYNSDEYDIPLLVEEFARVGILYPNEELYYIDVLKNERRLNPNTLEAVYKRRTGKKLEGAHNAIKDVKATYEILMCQLEGDEDATPESIDLACQGNKKRHDVSGKTYYNDEGIVCWSFGKLINRPVLEDSNVARDYLNWVLSGNFPMDLKNKLIQLKNK